MVGNKEVSRWLAVMDALWEEVREQGGREK
jgi:hypothetical protein